MLDDTGKFKNASGNYFLNLLFFEEAKGEKEHILYSLKDRDHEGFPSLYRLYMEMEDVFEYTFANTYFDGWRHWVLLCDTSWFKPFIERWRKELEIKIRSEALNRLRQDATGASRSTSVSNRYLLDAGWIDDKRSKGRPTKAAIKKAAREAAEQSATLDADYQRLIPEKATSVQ